MQMQAKANLADQQIKMEHPLMVALNQAKTRVVVLEDGEEEVRMITQDLLGRLSHHPPRNTIPNADFSQSLVDAAMEMSANSYTLGSKQLWGITG